MFINSFSSLTLSPTLPSPVQRRSCNVIMTKKFSKYLRIILQLSEKSSPNVFTVSPEFATPGCRSLFDPQDDDVVEARHEQEGHHAG